MGLGRVTGLNQRMSSGLKNIQRTTTLDLWHLNGWPVSITFLRMMRSESAESSAPVATGQPAATGARSSSSGRKASTGAGAKIAGA